MHAPRFVVLLLSMLGQRCVGCASCDRLSQQYQQQQRQLFQQQQLGRRTLGSPRPFGAVKPTRVQEFNRTGVLHPEYQIPATLRPGNVSQFYYLSPREGPPLTLLVSPCSGPISWTVSYVEPPGNNRDAEGAKSQTRWPVKSLKPGSPLFAYEGAEDQNFTIPKTRAGLYWFEIKSTKMPDTSPEKEMPSTVLLYATTTDLDRASQLYPTEGLKHRRSLRFQQRRNKRRLTVSWDRSHLDPHLSHYCLAVTSGSQPHPTTLCAAQNILQTHTRPPKDSSSIERRQHRHPPEGLHCVRQTKLTLHNMKYNAVYNFTLYVVNLQNNVSNRIAVDMVTFRRTPEMTLRTGQYTTAILRKNDYLSFRYRPQYNTSSTFQIFPCGDGILRVKLTGTGYSYEKEIKGHISLEAPPLPSKKSYTLHISAISEEIMRISSIKVLATPNSQIPSKSMPHEYRNLRTCHEVSVGVEPAGSGKYCILVEEWNKPLALATARNMRDQCDLHRKRQSERTHEICEERRSLPKDKKLVFTLKRLKPGKSYLLQITAQLKGYYLSFPLLSVRTKRSCRLNEP